MAILKNLDYDDVVSMRNTSQSMRNMIDRNLKFLMQNMLRPDYPRYFEVADGRKEPSVLFDQHLINVDLMRDFNTNPTWERFQAIYDDIFQTVYGPVPRN